MSMDWVPPAEDEPPADRPSWSRLLGVLGLAVGLVVALNLLTGGAGSTPTRALAPARPAAPPTAEAPMPIPCPTGLGGVELDGTPRPRGTPVVLERCVKDPHRRQGMVLRRARDGSIGRNSAVVTWPVAAYGYRPTGLELSPDGHRRELVWEVGGDLARVHGDLPEWELIAIAERVTVQQDILLIGPPPGFFLLYANWYPAALTHEVRYFPLQANLVPYLGANGLVFTGMQRSAELEDLLLDDPGRRAVGAVHGHPAMLTSRLGSAAVLWEPTPGTWAYVAYTGIIGTEQVGQALVELARTSRELTDAEFQSRL
ncbi:MAG TPA: hypothetical protein VFJ97_14225 [Dermatophilaceae bacterium]|nr:hypothetical protein [Dermatophilaceae bacterium]